jgi:isoquinoline 1-oxidoreductase alpha subunit
MQKIRVNGHDYEIAVEPDTPLLWVLRDTLGLTGTKYGCGIAQCGACTVHIDGQATRSCQIQVGDLKPSVEVRTIEAIEADSVGRKVVDAWVAAQAPQCGYCQSGQVMAATALLKANPKPSEAEIAQAMTNLCRCGTYNKIADAVRLAAG